MKSALLCLMTVLGMIAMNSTFAESQKNGSITIHNSPDGCWSVGDGSRLSLALAANAKCPDPGMAYIGVGEKHVFSGLDVTNCQYTLLIYTTYPAGSPSCGRLGPNVQILPLSFPDGSTKSEIIFKNQNNQNCTCQINFGN